MHSISFACIVLTIALIVLKLHPKGLFFAFVTVKLYGETVTVFCIVLPLLLSVNYSAKGPKCQAKIKDPTPVRVVDRGSKMCYNKVVTDGFERWHRDSPAGFVESLYSEPARLDSTGTHLSLSAYYK